MEVIHNARRKDFRVDWFSGTGAGGQYRNKHQNCCRITHIETGLVGQSTEYRERPANQKAAFKRLAALLVKYWVGEERKTRWPAPTETIRSYHEPDNRVKDHASGVQLTYSEIVDARHLAPMIEARREACLIAAGRAALTTIETNREHGCIWSAMARQLAAEIDPGKGG